MIESSLDTLDGYLKAVRYVYVLHADFADLRALL
jgi:hypothetical protein